MRIFWPIIVVTGDILVTAGNNQDNAFRNCELLSTCKTEINDLFKQTNFTKFVTECIKSSLSDYFSAFILVTGDITVTVDNNTDVAFTNCVPFSTYKREDNDLFKQNNSANFETESIKSSLWDYFEAFILIAWYITVTAENKNNTDVAFLNFTPFSTCKTPINYLFEQNIFAQFETESIKSSLWGYFDAFFLITEDITVTADNNNIDDAFTKCGLFSTCKADINDLFKQNKCTEFETETIKWSVCDYFDTFTLISGDIIVKAGKNTYVAFRNCALFSTCGTENKEGFKQNNSTKFETECIKSSLWDYFGPFILITGDITVTADNNTDVAVTTFAPFSTCKTQVNDLLKQNNSANFEPESIKSNLLGYLDTFTLVTGDIAEYPYNNTDFAFTNCELFSTSKTEINDSFKEGNSTKFESESTKSSLWDYLDAFILFEGDVRVTADNNTDIRFTNCPLFSTSQAENNDFFKQNNSPKFQIEDLKSSLWDYLHVFILVTGDLTAKADNNTDDAFTNYALFSTCKTEINDSFKQNKCTEFETETIKLSVCYYFDTFTLIAGDIIVKAGTNTDVTFRNCALFSTCGRENQDWFKQNNSTYFETECIKWILWDQFDAFILVTGDTTLIGYNKTDDAFKNYEPLL